MEQLEVTIRPLRLSDAAAVQRYASDERVARTATIPQPYPGKWRGNFRQERR